MQNLFSCVKFNNMKNSLWQFKNAAGTFASSSANKIKSLYFPLCNHAPIISSLSPDLHGDIKTGYHTFLLEPASRVSLINSKTSRNFWIYIDKDKYWSAAGVSKDTIYSQYDKFSISAGLLWHKITRQNKKLGLKAEITSFVPAETDPVEIMSVKITNISSKSIEFTPTAAIPLYCRSADNLRDHRHVTSLLQRIKLHKFGVIAKPTLCFDEAGHRVNDTFYFALGFNDKSNAPAYIYPDQEDFIGNSDLEAPDAVLKNKKPDKKSCYQGKEPMAGLKFKPACLKPKHTCSFTVMLGITKDEKSIHNLLKKFNTPEKTQTALEQNIAYWQKLSSKISVDTADKDFDAWLRWVNIQPVLRKIFGCSFLPDFDYGKGGRGWRDLWQDCLSLILTDPDDVRPLLLNNFKGVRINGSNATIIGSKPGEFIADRNNLPRIWMDHGVWPMVTTDLYIQQTGDLNILFEEIEYFADPLYKGTVLEHLILQNMTQFFNVGAHNNILLQGADWNDGLDMAREHGESVAFSCMYAQNLETLYKLIKKSAVDKIRILKEATVFLNDSHKTDYSNAEEKQALLKRYYKSVETPVSGEKVDLDKNVLLNDLKCKSDWLKTHIKNQEWLKEGFFNGYYDNKSRRVEGKINGLMRMTLTGQVFPVMSGIAGHSQIKILYANAKKYLQDKKLGGFRLNTDFKQEQHDLGRAFSFAYGDKENGAFFNHMAVMFSFALYKQNFTTEGFEVFSSIYKMALNSRISRIYPCLPEYFNNEGRGMYSYLTGSASWFMLTLLTRIFGIRGEFGDLVIDPKLPPDWFKKSGELKINTSFAGKSFTVSFINRKGRRKNSLSKITLNNRMLSGKISSASFTIIPRKTLLQLPQDNILQVYLT